jgi:hypothetical protein
MAESFLHRGGAHADEDGHRQHGPRNDRKPAAAQSAIRANALRSSVPARFRPASASHAREGRSTTPPACPPRQPAAPACDHDAQGLGIGAPVTVFPASCLSCRLGAGCRLRGRKLGTITMNRTIGACALAGAFVLSFQPSMAQATKGSASDATTTQTPMAASVTPSKVTMSKNPGGSVDSVQNVCEPPLQKVLVNGVWTCRDANGRIHPPRQKH